MPSSKTVKSLGFCGHCQCSICTAAIPEVAKHNKGRCCWSTVVGASWSPCVVSCALAAGAWVGTHFETKLVTNCDTWQAGCERATV